MNGTDSTTATFSFVSGHVYMCSLNTTDSGWVDCGGAGSVTYTGLSIGQHTFKVRTMDGGKPGSVETYQWTIVAPSSTFGLLQNVLSLADHVRHGLSAATDAVRHSIPAGILRLLSLLLGAAAGLLRRLG